MSSFKKIDSDSTSACSSSFNIFDIPQTNVSVNRGSYREFLPIATVTNDGPYTIRIHADNQWIDTSKCYFYLVASIQKYQNDEWKALENADNVSVCNNFALSFIRNLKMDLNGVEFYDSNNLAAYRSYLMALLSYDTDVKNSWLAAQGFYTDDDDQNFTDNGGLKDRAALFKNGKKAHFMAKLDFDLANQPLYLLNNTELIFTIHRSPDRFLIILPQTNPPTAAVAGDPTDYRIVVHDVRMYVKMLDVMPSVNLAVLKKLLTTPAKYSMRKVELRSTFITSGRTELTHNVFTNVIPRRIILGMVNSKAYNGDFKLSPFNFEPMKIRSASIEANGMIYPMAPYNLDFPNDVYVRAFNDLYDTLGLIGQNKTCNISYFAYKNLGYTLFGFQLTSDLSDSNAFELIKNGTTVIKLLFSDPIPVDGVELIVFAEFDSILSITNERVIVSDGSV